MKINAPPDTFERFLLDYHRDDPIGDLANDFRRVRRGPELLPGEAFAGESIPRTDLQPYLFAQEHRSDEELFEYLKDRVRDEEIVSRAWKLYEHARKGTR